MPMPQQPEGLCLRCLRPPRSTRPCVIEAGGGRILHEWPEHHRDDWNDAELHEFSLTRWRWPLNRRTMLADLRWDQLESDCERDGHEVFDIEGSKGCDHCHHPLVWVATADEAA
ncbi:hypothetical protein LG314_03370 [Agrococcus terreus]|uniref:hypothetical protein n=1 Tax=Agrococcus terreus TaxID=574649 RepID=UPI00384D386D